MSDSYRTIDVRVRSVLPASIVVNRPRADGTVTIARSLLHYADDKRLDDLPRGYIDEAWTLRVREWKAEALGFA